MEKRIIPLYTPPHSSHLLQPLDVSCFSPLKHLYGQRIQEKIQKGIFSIGKEDFIHIYPEFHQQALSLSNIKSGFAVTGLIPFCSERVLSKIPKTPTPPSTSHSDLSFSIGITPANIQQLEYQKKKVSQKEVLSPTTMDEAVRKLVRSNKRSMQYALLLQH